MRETDLDDVFAEFEARTAPTFRPPGLAAAGRRVRDRRVRRRGLLAGVAVLLLAGPGGAYALAGRDGDATPPTPVPGPTGSPSPGGPPVERRIAVPGVAGELRDLWFVDARHAWAFFDTCARDEAASTGCRRDLARTEDGGATWQRAAVPATANATSPGSPPYLLVADGRRATLAVADRFLVTSDGGDSFTEHPMTDPPPAGQLAPATRSGFLLHCPPPNGSTGRACDQVELIHVERGRLANQPPVDLGPTAGQQFVEGRDGRLWVAAEKDGRMTVVVSDDQGSTWRKLPPVAGARRLLVSPDGADVWLVSVNPSQYEAPADDERVWALAGDRWQERAGLPDSTVGVAAVDGNRLVVTGAYGTVGFWTPSGYLDRPEVRRTVRDDSMGTDVDVLRDGAIVLKDERSWTVGVGTGTERSWTRFS